MGEITINPHHNIHKKYREMNLVNPYIFTPPITYNTYIGGVASTISTASALATKLGISVGAISNFTVVGSDIKCKITGSYALGSAFLSDSSITYYNDNDSLVTSLNQTFYNASNLLSFKLEGVTSISGERCFEQTSLEFLYFPALLSVSAIAFADGINRYKKRVSIYMPNCSTLGSTVNTDESVLSGIITIDGNLFYLKPSLFTANAGAEEADVLKARNAGAFIRYKTSYTNPNPITASSIGNVYATAIQLIDNGLSTNAIDFYENVKINGISYPNLQNNGYIIGLLPSTSYSIEAIAVDVFYNKSVTSTISVSTNATEQYPMSNIVSYYQMEGNANDILRVNNNTIRTAITYGSGLVGQNAIFNGSSSFISIPDSNNLSFGNSTIDLPFSLSFILNLNSTGNQVLVNKLGGSTATDEYFFAYWGGELSMSLKSYNNNALSIDCVTTTGLTTGVNNVITFTYNGSRNQSGLKIYVNGILKTTTNTMNGSYLCMGNKSSIINIGKAGWTPSNFLNGKLDELIFWNTELTASQIADINTKLQSGNHL